VPDNPTLPTLGPRGAAEPLPKVGPYELLKLLGQGGMGAVYLARHPELRREVALKLLPSDASAEDIERFKREARAAARLRHRGIVSVHEVGEDAGRHYFTMDFIAGGTLHDLLKKGRMPAHRAFELMQKLAYALDYAHKQGVVHRDLKPQNIMLDDSGEPLISDFGLARVANDVSLSRSGQMFGTPNYMAPEQARADNRRVDARSDLWSLGACLYQMLSGSTPFEGTSVIDVLLQVSEVDPKPLRARSATVPRDAEAIVFKCMTKEPAGRYQTAAELAEDIGRFLEGRPVTARPVTAMRRAFAWLRRNRAIAATATLGVVGVTATLLWTLWLGPAMRTAARHNRLRSLELLAATGCVSESERLVKALERGDDPGAVIRETKDVASAVKARLAPKDPEETAAVERGLATYRAGPVLSHAHYKRGEWSLAYRHDPTGPWGLNAQVELARECVGRFRLDEAATLLRRVRGRFPESEAARRAIPVLGDVLIQQGDLTGALAAYRDSGTQPERVKLLEAITGERHAVAIPPRAVGASFDHGYEPMPLLRLDAPTIVLPFRAGRPAFRVGRDGLTAVPSPLAVLPPGDEIAEVCDADLDGDGTREVLAAVYRSSQGGGYAVIVRDGGAWKLKHLELTNSANSIGVCAGDLTGDGRDEAFVTFMWRTAHQWLVQEQAGRIVTTPFHPGGSHPWMPAAAIVRVGDRHVALLGRSGQLSNTVDVWDGRDGRVGKRGEIVVGEANAFAADGDGLVAILANAFPAHVSRPELRQILGDPPDDSLVVLRWREGGFDEISRRRLSSGDAMNTDVGSVSCGRLAGRSVIAFTTTRGAVDPLKKQAEGLRLRVVAGDPAGEPVAFGLPWATRSFRLLDLDGDGESELIVLLEEKLVVAGRRTGAPPKLKEADVEVDPGSEAARLLRAADDLLSTELFEDARDLLLEIATRFPGTMEATEALRIRCDAYLRQAELLFAKARAQRNVAEALATETSASAQCLAAAREARDVAARFPDQPALRRRFFLLAAEASRLAADFEGQCRDLNAALDCARAYDDAALRSTRMRVEDLTQLSPVVTGDPTHESFPFVTDAPTRVRRAGGALELVADSRSERFVAGIPLAQLRTGFTLELDLEIETSCWTADVRFGLVPRDRTIGIHAGALRLWMWGNTAWDTQSAVIATPGGNEIALGGYRSKWRLSWLYAPEVELQRLQVFDREGRLYASSRGGTVPIFEGPALLGVLIDYYGGDALLTHRLHPPHAVVRISNVVFKAARTCGVDGSAPLDSRGFELAAGGRFLRGDLAGAADGYRHAIERDGRALRPRIMLALCAKDAAPLAEALAIDPYATVADIDDLMRGAAPAHQRAMGELLQALLPRSTGIARAACLAFLGEFEKCAAALSTVPSSPARHYLFRRNWIGETPALLESWEWLVTRGLRTAGLSLPVVAWAPGPGESADSAREALQEAAQARNALQMWVAASRWLLLKPDDLQALRFRAEICLAIQEFGQAELDALRIAELAPKDPAMLMVPAIVYARKTATRETMEFLEKAVAAGLRGTAALDRPEFGFLKENESFKRLRAKLETE